MSPLRALPADARQRVIARPWARAAHRLTERGSDGGV